MPNPSSLELPQGTSRCLLHACCAPCNIEVMRAMSEANIDYTIFFYNPNIHPKAEYELRKEETMRYAQKEGIPYVDGDYNAEDWFRRMKGLENEPERGMRCTSCFDMRFEVSAQYAIEHGFDVFTSCLGISRWKNLAQINACGERAAARHPGLTYWTYNWRKEGGSERMIQLSKEENFYQQEYCGCFYSLRDTNRWRIQGGRKPIEIGVKFYGKN